MLAGCVAVDPGPLCRGADATLTAWVALTEGEQVEAPAGAVAVAGGARVRLKGAGEIRVRGREPVAVRVAPSPEGSPGRRLHAEGRQANREGRADEAVRLLTEAGARQAADGDASGAALTAVVLSFVHLEAGRLADARATLARHRPPPADGAARAMHHYFEALVARAGGDARGALRAFDASTDLATRLDLPLLPILREERAMTHLELGRVDEALVALEALAAGADALPVCKQADLFANLGWARLASPRARDAGTGDLLRRAVDRFAACDKASPLKRANARLNLALWALRAGRADEAAPPPLPEGAGPELRAWARYLSAHGEATPEARLAALDALAEQTADAALERLRWRVLVDAGVLLGGLGDHAGAAGRLARAEAVVAARALDVPVDAGRVAFAADRHESAARLVAALRAKGDVAGAMDAARRARRRVLTTLPTAQAVSRLDAAGRARWEAALARYQKARTDLARDAAGDWERSAEALAAARAARAVKARALRGLLDEALGALAAPGVGEDAPLAASAPGEALLTWARRPDGGWAVFVRDAAGTVAADVEPPAWTAPVRGRLAAADSVRVLAVGPTGEAALDLAGRPAVYAMDLPPRSTRAAGSTALLVADPTGDLPGARREADRVAPGLTAVRPTVRRLVGAAATRAAVRAALAEADHLHYAGHGRYAGFEGWDSALPLRDGPLALGDLLVLPRVPATVVLSGCETGRAEGDTAQGLGLAHAFLLRGAEAVVAPVRPVDDGAAAAFGEALYAALGDAPDLPAAFARVAGRSEAVDYRVFVP